MYEASAVLRIDPERADSLAIADHPATMPSEPGETLHTEIVILKSDDVAIRTLNTLTDDDFATFTGSHRGMIPIPQDVQNLSESAAELDRKTDKELITVKQIDGTQLITVTVRYTDPKVAAAIGNAVIRSYSVQTFEDRAHSVAQLRTWLSTQMDELKNHVAVAQAKLTDFEQANDVVETEGASNTIADRLHFLSERLSTAQSDSHYEGSPDAGCEWRKPERVGDSVSKSKAQHVAGSPGYAVCAIRAALIEIRPELSSTCDLAKQMRRIDVEIRQEVQSVRERLNTDYAGAKRAQDMLQAEYDKQIDARLSA